MFILPGMAGVRVTTGRSHIYHYHQVSLATCGPIKYQQQAEGHPDRTGANVSHPHVLGVSTLS